MESRNRIIATLSALYLVALAFTPGNHARTIPAGSDRSSKASDEAPQRPQESISRSEAFTGTILKSGIDFLLRDNSGEVYLLDVRKNADLFEGKNVRITGIPEADAKILHAEEVEEITA
jgi:hypothetical protein